MSLIVLQEDWNMFIVRELTIVVNSYIHWLLDALKSSLFVLVKGGKWNDWQTLILCTWLFFERTENSIELVANASCVSYSSFLFFYAVHEIM